MRSFQTGTGVLGNHHIVGLGVKPLATLREIQNKIGVHDELRPFQLFQAILYDFSIAVDEKDT
ncbi:MAG: hypothetical protein WA857_05565 [Candidatus Acidiferrum sp.]